MLGSGCHASSCLLSRSALAVAMGAAAAAGAASVDAVVVYSRSVANVRFLEAPATTQVSASARSPVMSWLDALAAALDDLDMVEV